MKKFFTSILFCFILNVSSLSLFSQALFEEKIILEDFLGATDIVAADFDLDNDIDFAVTGFDGDQIGWFENDGSQNFTSHLVVTGFDAPKGIDVGRIDNNNSWDIVTTASGPGKFSWFSNDGSGIFTEHIIADTGWTKAGFVLVADIDSDSDDDIVLIACDSHKIGWAENDGSGQFSIHILKENWTKTTSATVIDIDKDNDKDIIATAKAGQIIWFVNDGHANFSEHILVEQLPGANSVHVCDLDHDEDMDLVATACDNTDQVAWYENTGNYNFEEHILKGHYDGARASEIADLDLDGDVDILSIAWQKGVVNFFENNGSGVFAERSVCDSAYDMINLFVINLDQDNDLDILGACYADHEIRWWESIDTFLIPDFSADQTSGNDSLMVKFTDLSYGKPHVHSWSWDFNSDGIPDSHDQNPERFFDQPGYYNISLTVITDSATKSIEKESYIRIFDKENAIELNGSDSQVKCNNDSVTNLRNCFSYEAWIRPSGYGQSGNGKIFDKTVISIAAVRNSSISGIDSCFSVMMVHSDGTTSTSCTPSGSVKLNSWQHFAMTYNDTTGTIHIYLDGVDQSLLYINPPSGPLLNNSNREIYFGNSKSGNNGFQGCLDEIRLWTVERNQNEIQEWMGMNLPSGQQVLCGYWKINEIFGDTLFDQSGWKHHGVLSHTKWAQGVHLSSVGTKDQGSLNFKSGRLKVYPNPFSNFTNIEFSLPEKSFVDMIVSDINGKLVRTLLHNEGKGEGGYFIHWDGKDNQGRILPVGIYFLILSTGKERKSLKIQVTRG